MGIHTDIRRAVFLDRDGVITRPLVRNGRPFAPRTLDELEILPGVPEALRRLRGAGFELVVVTNQPDVARGTTGLDEIRRMHVRLTDALPIDDVRVCPHDDADACECRKPKDGLLRAAARERRLSLGDSFMIGDRWRDMEAGARAGCRTVFVDWSYDEPRPVSVDKIVRSLPEAVEWILTEGTA